MTCTGLSPGQVIKAKSSSVNQMSFNIVVKIFKALNLTYLFPIVIGMELAPFSRLRRDWLSRLHRAITLCLSW